MISLCDFLSYFNEEISFSFKCRSTSDTHHKLFLGTTVVNYSVLLVPSPSMLSASAWVQIFLYKNAHMLFPARCASFHAPGICLRCSLVPGPWQIDTGSVWLHLSQAHSCRWQMSSWHHGSLIFLSNLLIYIFDFLTNEPQYLHHSTPNTESNITVLCLSSCGHPPPRPFLSTQNSEWPSQNKKLIALSPAFALKSTLFIFQNIPWWYLTVLI